MQTMQRPVLRIFENHKFVLLLLVTSGDFLVSLKDLDQKPLELPAVEQGKKWMHGGALPEAVLESVAQKNGIKKCIKYP
ncbi:hypothetical protein KK083_30965 [Fulvivirgaceae bacterium PWU4]|uniref:Uncharacterized protein n=1 Tax=Chryseosolibacter histidini TaxID=2782349 RepID=A0AAP2DRR5_9BACT|nr:hypothetical protein [Chryseosolibacter histidini]MBT1701355.1 hypothetical protein [Chryseosolibacter histidini]